MKVPEMKGWQVVALVLLIIVLVLAALVWRLRCGGCGRNVIGGDEEADGGARLPDLAVRPPMYAKMLSGEKTIELRANRPPFKELKVGDEIQVRRSRAPDDKTEYSGERRYNARVTSRNEYSDLETALKKEGVKVVTPGITSAAKALESYREFISESDEKEHGIVALGVEKM